MQGNLDDSDTRGLRHGRSPLSSPVVNTPRPSLRVQHSSGYLLPTIRHLVTLDECL